MSNKLKNVNRFSLFLAGLAVAFSVISCDCDKKTEKDAKVTLTYDKEVVNVHDEITVTGKVTEGVLSKDTVIKAEKFDADTKKLSDLGVTADVKKDGDFSFKTKANDASAKSNTIRLLGKENKDIATATKKQ